MAERDNDANRGQGPEPVDEDAAWAAIVAGYDREAEDPALPANKAGTVSGGSTDDAGAETGAGSGPGEAGTTATGAVGDARPADRDAEADEPEAGGPSDPPVVNRPLGSGITVHPVVGVGPRDWSAPEPEGDEDDHFVPPEPPPLPEADTTTKFAWLAALGGPLLLLLAVILQWNMTWWLVTLGIGGFLGGFATLVLRMNDGDDEWDDPGRGAVV